MNRPGLSTLKPPVLIAHRGDKTRYPENTLVSFSAAIKTGAEMIELDIALSKDRHMVVIHDDSVDRTTNGTGAISDLSLAELKALDAGSWFEKKFAGEQIPTLAEVMELVDNRALVNIEIKKSAFENPAPADAIEQQLVTLIQEMNLEDSVLISSFELRLLDRISTINSKLALAAISLEPADEKIVETLRRLQGYSWHGWCETMTEDQIRMVHEAGYRVFSFTVNDPHMYQKLCGMGIDGVFTDDCQLLRQQV